MRTRVHARLAVLAVMVLFGTTTADLAHATAPVKGLRLTVGAQDGGWSRMVRLECDPVPAGPHPRSAAACAALDTAGGDFDALPGQSGVCHDDYRPLVTTARGTFRGQEVRWRKKFANACVLRAATGAVFAF